MFKRIIGNYFWTILNQIDLLKSLTIPYHIRRNEYGLANSQMCKMLVAYMPGKFS